MGDRKSVTNAISNIIILLDAKKPPVLLLLALVRLVALHEDFTPQERESPFRDDAAFKTVFLLVVLLVIFVLAALVLQDELLWWRNEKAVLVLQDECSPVELLQLVRL